MHLRPAVNISMVGTPVPAHLDRNTADIGRITTALAPVSNSTVAWLTGKHVAKSSKLGEGHNHVPTGAADHPNIEFNSILYTNLV